MDLYEFHRVLIVAAILFCVGLAVFAYRAAQVANAGSHQITMALSGVAAVGFLAYLIVFSVKLARIRRQEGAAKP